MEKQSQVRGGRRHSGGISARLVRHGITRSLTASAQISLSGTTYTVGKARAVCNTPPTASIHVSLEYLKSSNVSVAEAMNYLVPPLR